MEHRGNRKATGAANEFSRLLNTEVRVWMTRRGFTLVELAEASGVSKSRISKTVYKHEAPLNTNELDKLCRALGVSPLTIVKAAEQTLATSQRSARGGVVRSVDFQSDYARAAKTDSRKGTGRESGVEYYE